MSVKSSIYLSLHDTSKTRLYPQLAQLTAVRGRDRGVEPPKSGLSFVRPPVGRLGRNVAHPIGSPGGVEHFDVGLNETKCMEASANGEQVPDGHHESGDCLRRLARPMSRVRRPRRSFGKALTVLLRLAANGHAPRAGTEIGKSISRPVVMGHDGTRE